MDNNLTPGDRDKVGVYIVRNKVSREFYLGSGRLAQRLRYHERELANNRHVNYKLQKSFNKNPEMEFIGTAIDIERLPIELNRKRALELEQALIDRYKDNPLLLNIAMNVDSPTLGVAHSVEAKAKISHAAKEMWATMSPEKRKIRGEKISKAQSAVWSTMPQEEKNARTDLLRQANIGVPLSEEHRRKVGDFFRDKELSSSHREKISNALSGKPKDPVAVQNAVNARKEKGSYKSNEAQILACSHPVVVDGEVFSSMSECAKAKNITHQTVSNRIHNSNFPGWTLGS